MEYKIKATVNSDKNKKVAYSRGFILEMVFLTYGEEKVHGILKKLVDAGVGYSKEILNEPLAVPANIYERYHRALLLINAMGQAAGQALSMENSDEDPMNLCRNYFRDGILLKATRKYRPCSVIEQAFFSFGIRAGEILSSIRKLAGTGKNKFGKEMIEIDACKAFIEGIQKWVEFATPPPITREDYFSAFYPMVRYN